MYNIQLNSYILLYLCALVSAHYFHKYNHKLCVYTWSYSDINDLISVELYYDNAIHDLINFCGIVL